MPTNDIFGCQRGTIMGASSVTGQRSSAGVSGDVRGITMRRRAEVRSVVRAARGTVGLLIHEERGSATAEYAVATMAAVGFAGLLVVILKGDEVKGILTDLVRKALTANG
ncbi:DUF4244 domain-containing protein [Plantibacter sp. Mn2098]|uniref:DUF4244 domain-containing protein n=1 Tax=Plantibacter sp. Mn2098 TaxID=3395266 RepID=UPI003BD97429